MCLHTGKLILHEIHFLSLFIHSFPMVISKLQKQPLKAARWKSCFENMQQIYRRTREYSFQSVILIELLCIFIESKLWHVCPPVNSLHIFKIAFYKNMYGGLLLKLIQVSKSFLSKFTVESPMLC